MLLETEPDTERRENVSAARFRDTESHTAGVGLNSTCGVDTGGRESQVRCCYLLFGVYLRPSALGDLKTQ